MVIDWLIQLVDEQYYKNTLNINSSCFGYSGRVERLVSNLGGLLLPFHTVS